MWGVIAQVAGGLLQGQQAKQASAENVAANERALNLQEYQYNQNRADNLPVLQGRNTALNALLAELGLQGSDPAQIQRTQSLNDIDRQIADLQAKIPPIRAGKASPVPQIFHDLANLDGLTRHTTRPVTNYIRGAKTDGSGSKEERKIQDQIAALQAQRDQLNSSEISLGNGQTYVPAGPRSINDLTDGEKFALDEAIKSTVIASGGALGGNEMRALQDRSFGYLTTLRENRLNRLQDIVNGTSATAGSSASLQQSNVNSQGTILGNIGATRQSGYIDQSNAYTGILQGLAQQYGNQQTNQTPVVNNNPYNTNTTQLPAPF